MTSTSSKPGPQENSTPGLLAIFWVGLSLAIGWGIRGNFGHEYGAMIPGMLASLAAAILAGRADWHRRAVFFAFFGALGWSFGGSISYMQVIAYTHSGHSTSQLYGFACLFVIGFVWAAMGGAGAALPAFLNRQRLTKSFAPLLAVFAAWTLQDLIVSRFEGDPAFRQEDPLYWYDTDWLAALVAIAAVLILALIRRRMDSASSLILHMAIGWWIAFLVLVNGLGWRMTPPRGDNWAGCVGMVIGMWIYFQRNGLHGLTFASLICGFIGGFGFASGNLLKLLGVTTGWQTNWHSVLEQTYGFINGIGLAVAIFWVARRAPQVEDEPRVRKWTDAFATGFVLLVLTYLNLSKNPERWVKANVIPPTLVGLSVETWFATAWIALTVVFIALILVHQRRPLALLSINWLARAQVVYLIFLWVMVIGNFERALVGFTAQRLVTEGVIFLNATLCTFGIVFSSRIMNQKTSAEDFSWSALLPRTILVGSIAAALSILADWAVVRGVFGNQQAPHASKHIRFGPDATATKEKPKPGVPHP